ncbi:MAG: hypothetical protein CMG20_00950 [Candidatus Marinimicrobia bacterium]|nr:hypothetical protein [Candidatus Neomarinimicrobiota bacterium]
MHNYFSTKWVLITSVIFLSFNACSEETIVYSEIENPNYTINTLTLPLDQNKVFQINPTSGGGGGKFYFGDVKGSENLFTLFSLTLFSGSLPPTALFDLLADSIQVDSALVYMQTGDSLNSASNLSLYSIVATEDSIFSEDSTSYYSLDNYIDFENNATLLHQIPLVNIEPDSAGYDTLDFLFKDDNLELLKEFYFDTFTYPARTLMLKNDEPLDELFTIESDESSRQPRMRVWYKATVNDTTTIDTSILFFGDKGLSIFSPQIVEEEDKNYVTLNSGSGLRSVLRYDLDIINELERNSIVKNANLVLNIESSNLEEGDEFYVVVAALSDSVENWDFTTFLSDDESLSDSAYVSDQNFIISRKVEDGKIEIPIQAFLQSYKNDVINNHGLMLYSGPVNSPFDKIRLDTESVEVLYVKP